jgi:hypothetical protein
MSTDTAKEGRFGQQRETNGQALDGPANDARWGLSELARAAANRLEGAGTRLDAEELRVCDRV